jgi:hypothetical protein
MTHQYVFLQLHFFHPSVILFQQSDSVSFLELNIHFLFVQTPHQKEKKYILLIRKKLVCPRFLCSILVIRSACASSEAMARKKEHCLTAIGNNILKLTVNTKKGEYISQF